MKTKTIRAISTWIRRQGNRTNRARTGLVIAGFAVVGMLAVAVSQAATFMAAQEAESGTLAGNASRLTAASGASGGGAVRFGGGTTPPSPTPPSPTGTVLSVAKSGGDYNTINAAVKVAKPGDTIVVDSGTYNEHVIFGANGSVGKYISLQSKSGAKVILDGSGISMTSGDGLIGVNSRQHIRISGITVANSQGTAIWGVGVDDIVVENCVVQNIQHGGIVMINGSNVIANDNDVSRTNLNSNADHESISFNNINTYEVARNKVHDNLEEGIDMKYETTNGSVHDNVTTNNGGPNIYIDGAQNTKVYNNRVHDTTGENKNGIGLAIENFSKTKVSNNIDVYNNVVSGSVLAGIGFWIESTGTFSNVHVYNNTLDNNRFGINVSPATVSFSGTNYIRNNIIASFGSNGTSVNYERGAVTTLPLDHNLFLSRPFGTAALTGDAKFVNPSAKDYHLQSGSPAINAGSADGAPATDLDGKARSGAPDIGAYEF